ncbi:DUF885 domain-containing protein [Sphingomonas ginsenosidivorax]|uniref:DUF885 domain-containing protein n=1 Tax=Sphingomonas ginsenosidivorax TaxID=862135 RepID=A0A5C6UF67_9SPHN|nr:DUF885 domain-containing protein [Sphingomonas ginsenosidivorax]TXC71114.1 DUF885 domain-containing protein [Sphingomonas ginsenosidivorax]
MRLGLALSVAALALVGATMPERPAVAAQSAATPAASWAGFRDGFIEGWFRIDPAGAVYQGRHDFDGGLGDWSPAGLKVQGDFLRASIARAKGFTALTGADAFERDYLITVAQGKLFWLEDADQPHRNPAWYVNAGLDPNVYVARNYAPAAVRLKALTVFLEKVPTATANIRANLKAPMPLSYVNFGAAAFNGFADYYTGDAKAAFASVKDPALQKQFDVAAAAASKSMKALGAWLESQRATATQDFALGPDRFARMIQATEGVDTPLATLTAVGQADLKRNQAALAEACGKFAPGATIPACMAKMNANKPVGGPVAAARLQIPTLRKFVVDHDLVTIPGTEAALVEESPPYNRQNSAYIDPPGPFDKGVPSVYYISPPDPSWTKAVQDAFVPGKQDLLFTSVHEVMPGHFLQFLHANRSPSLFGRLFVGYAFAEGWAHYTEEMMWEAGLNDGDPETHVGQISNALLRDCRFLSAIGLHANGMTQEQSFRMFVDQCYQDEGNARQQAARGTYDPAYLNYTLGKLMIRKLRTDWTATRGGRKAWKAFHDQVLSYGGPPIPLLRQAMMGEAKATSAF